MKDSHRWLLHFITGACLLVLLGLHMGVMHLGDLVAFYYRPPEGAEAIDWAAVAGRAKDVSVFVMYILFLLAALYHGLYGLWNILIEAFARRNVARPLGWILALLGAGLFAYGSYTTYLAYIH